MLKSLVLFNHIVVSNELDTFFLDDVDDARVGKYFCYAVSVLCDIFVACMTYGLHFVCVVSRMFDEDVGIARFKVL